MPLVPVPASLERVSMQTERCRFLITLDKLPPHERMASIRAASCWLITEAEAVALKIIYSLGVR